MKLSLAEILPTFSTAASNVPAEYRSPFDVDRRGLLVVEHVKTENARRRQVEVAADDDLRAFVWSGGKPGAAFKGETSKKPFGW